MVLTCGGAMPAEFDRYSPCDVADGVGWFIPDSLREDPTADVTMTTIGRRPIVAVTIPAALRPEGVPAVMSELAGSLRRHTRLLHRCV